MRSFKLWSKIKSALKGESKIIVIERDQEDSSLDDFECLVNSDNYLYSRLYNTPEGFYHGGDIRITVSKKNESTLFVVDFFNKGSWIGRISFYIVDQIDIKYIDPSWSYSTRYLCIGDATREELIFIHGKYMEGFK